MGNALHIHVIGRLSRGLCRFAFLAMVFLVCSPASSYAFNSYHAHISDTDAPVQIVDDVASHGYVTNSPPPSVVDSCLPLLESIHHTSPSLATDRNQRSAGNAAPLGLVIGVRLALSSPKKTTSSRSNQARFGFWQPLESMKGDRRALSVADYRDCQKKEAMKALGEFRWKR